jgi:hypothetical protein
MTHTDEIQINVLNVIGFAIGFGISVDEPGLTFWLGLTHVTVVIEFCLLIVNKVAQVLLYLFQSHPCGGF